MLWGVALPVGGVRLVLCCYGFDCQSLVSLELCGVSAIVLLGRLPLNLRAICDLVSLFAQSWVWQVSLLHLALAFGFFWRASA